MLSVSGMVLLTLLAASSNVLPEEMALTTPPDVLPRKYVEYPKISDCAKMSPPKLLVVKTVIVAAWAGVASKSAESSSSFFMVVTPLAHGSFLPSTCETMHTGQFISVGDSRYFLDDSAECGV